MALVKCVVCDEKCWESVSINAGTIIKPLWFCSHSCSDMFFEYEAQKDAEMYEADMRINESIRKGVLESGIKSDDVPDGLILNWIDTHS